MIQKAFFFSFMLCGFIVTAQSGNYLLFDATHMKSMIYGNLGQDADNRTHAYFIGDAYNETFLETGARETITLSKLPKGTLKYTGYKWDASLAKRINGGNYKIKLLIPQGNDKYISTPIRFVTNVQKNGKELLFTAPDYAFSAHLEGMDSDVNLALAGSYNYIFYQGTTTANCLPLYTFRREPDEVCLATTFMSYVPGVGIVEEHATLNNPTDVAHAPIQLLTINGKSLEEYTNTVCEAKATAASTTLAVLDAPAHLEEVLPTTEVAQAVMHSTQIKAPKTIKKTVSTKPASASKAKKTSVKAVSVGVPATTKKTISPIIAEYQQPVTIIQPAKTSKTKVEQKPIATKKETVLPVMASTPSTTKVVKTPLMASAPSTTEVVKTPKTTPPAQTALSATSTTLATKKETAATASCPEQPGSGYHIVRRGESPYAIAKAYGVDYEALIRLNKIVDPTLVPICHKLWIVPPPDGVIIEEQMLPATYATNSHTSRTKTTPPVVARQWNTDTAAPAPATYTTATKEPITPSSEVVVAEAIPMHDVVYTEKEVEQKPIAHASSIIHTVKEGETLYSIATFYGYSVERFAVMNGLRLDVKLYPGMELTASDNTCKLDLDAPTTKSTPKGVTYHEPAEYSNTTNIKKNTGVFSEQQISKNISGTANDKYSYSVSGDILTHIVASNESIGDIAARYGVSIEKIYVWNKMEKNETIVPGQTLIVKR